MYIISLSYTSDISEVELHLAEHIRYLEEQYSAGRFLASGRKVPRTGGVILATAGSHEELDAILELDPFYQHSVADYEVTEFIASKAAPDLGALLNR